MMEYSRVSGDEMLSLDQFPKTGGAECFTAGLREWWQAFARQWVIVEHRRNCDEVVLYGSIRVASKQTRSCRMAD